MIEKILMLVAVAIAYFLISVLMSKFVQRLGHEKALSPVRVKYVSRCIKLGLLFLLVISLLMIIGLGYSQISVFLSSVFAVIGVALFAQWSMLSNLTASLIIFFAFPYRVGDRVKVVDKDDDISGEIEEIAAFHVLIRRANGDLVTYPNALILQKAVIKLSSKEVAGDDDKLIGSAVD